LIELAKPTPKAATSGTVMVLVVVFPFKNNRAQDRTKVPLPRLARLLVTFQKQGF